jgi:hypothetical protein
MKYEKKGKGALLAGDHQSRLHRESGGLILKTL